MIQLFKNTPQVPSRSSMTPDKDLECFKEEVPALGLLGNPCYIDPHCPYTVDDDVQLVCTYLRAYDSGNINMLYYEEEDDANDDEEESDAHKEEGDPFMMIRKTFWIHIL